MHSDLFNDHKDREAEFKKLDTEFKVGQRVVFACGLVGHGLSYERKEAKIIEVGQSSVKIQFGDFEHWVQPSIITDILEN